MKERALTADAREAKGLHDGSVTCLVRPVTDLIKQDESPSNIRLHDGEWQQYGAGGVWIRLPAPFGVVGDRLFVQEAFRAHRPFTGDFEHDMTTELITYYAADIPKYRDQDEWLCAEDLPRELCRTLLDVADVRVVRVQEVPGQDMLAAGMTFGCRWCTAADACAVVNVCEHPRDEFREAVGRAVFDANKWLWLATVAKVEA